MTPKDDILAALRRQPPSRIPVFEWFIDQTVLQDLAGTTDPIDATEILNLDAVNVRPDYEKKWIDELTYLDEWGIQRKLTGDVLAAAVSHPIEELANHKAYTFPKVDASHRFRTLERAMNQYGDRRAIVLNLRDGFSDARDLLGYQNALMGVLLDKENYVELLKRIVEYNVAVAELAVKRFGVQIVATTDDVCTADGPLFSPKAYKDVLYPAFREVMQGYRDLDLLIIKHCDGDIRPFLDLWIDAGIHCLDPIDPGAGLDMGEMKAKYGGRICLKGNIDCTGHLCDGTPEQVAEEVRLCIEKGRGHEGGLIVSSSNTIHRGVKSENFKAMIEAVRKNEK